MRLAWFAPLLAIACSPAQPATQANVQHQAPQPTTRGSPARSATPIVEEVLREWSTDSRCDGTDWFPHGDLRSFWCHRPARGSLAVLRTLSGTPVFAQGPHKDDLDLKSASDFGRYDPAFVRWLVGNVPARGSAAQTATQAAYVAKLSPLAEVFWHTLQKIEHEKKCFEGERQAYEEHITKKTLPADYYERWLFFMNPWFCEKGTSVPKEFYYENAFDGGGDGKAIKSVVGFWLRRSIDGTFAAFAEGLRKLLAAYEPDLLTTEWRPPDPTSLQRAIDGGTKAAAACKDPNAPAESVYVAITVHHDGAVEAWIKSPAVKATRQATCIEKAFAAQKVPAFEGKNLPFTRTLPLK